MSVVFKPILDPKNKVFIKIWIVPLSPQKETHNESCGFFVFQVVENSFSKDLGKQKTSER